MPPRDWAGKWERKATIKMRRKLEKKLSTRSELNFVLSKEGMLGCNISEEKTCKMAIEPEADVIEELYAGNCTYSSVRDIK